MDTSPSIPSESAAPREREEIEPGVVEAQWWHRLDDGRVQCDLCPRHCRMRDDQAGFCFVRQARDGRLVLRSYGRAIGYCTDPVEKKPLTHFYPGTDLLSLGTAGCNLGCRSCRTWDPSLAREMLGRSASASPLDVAQTAVQRRCRGVAFTYNDPIVFAEYAIDCAQQARAHGLASVAVSNGYVDVDPRRALFTEMDAANIDIKAFSGPTHRKICLAELEPVLDTLRWIRHQTDVWLELTCLLIPGHNDDLDEVQRLCAWVRDVLGPEVPLHFTAFRPDFRMLDVDPTPPDTVRRARRQGLAAGLRHVYTGNIHDPEGQSTYCAGCGHLVIARDGHQVLQYRLDVQGRCRHCSRPLAGRFDPYPGSARSRTLPVFPSLRG